MLTNINPLRYSRARSPRIQAIIPIKPLELAKNRLAPILGERRVEFARMLVGRTLDAALGRGLFAGITIVSPDPRIALDAGERGVEVLDDGGAALNDACTMGLAATASRGADIFVILPADLALLTSFALSHLIEQYLRLRDGLAMGGPLIGLVRCKDGTGTNLVISDSPNAFRPAFGIDSFAAHLRATPGRAYELVSAEVAFDVDTPRDLSALKARLSYGDPQDPLKLFLDEVFSDKAITSSAPGAAPARALIEEPVESLTARASAIRDSAHPVHVSYSRKVFLPLTHLCRDRCHYCTFAQPPKRLASPYMSLDQVIAVAENGAKLGCKEALFTLGDRPEARYRVAREWLDEHEFASTLHYVAHAAAAVRDRTGLLPHINAGCMTARELAMLRPVAASMGLMLESAAARLCAKGGPHYGSPDKAPAVRLATIAEAGRQHVPFTSGLLIGIGETRLERVEALLQLRDLHERYGHIQEIIIQNFVPKPTTVMAGAAAPATIELRWTIAVARILFGPQMSIQAPPNLNAGSLPMLIEAGINDWGGVSPVTPDFVNPEAPWPEIDELRSQTATAGKTLVERLTIYPSYAKQPAVWLDAAMRRHVSELSDGIGLAREDGWRTGRSVEVPAQRAAFGTSNGKRPLSLLLGDIMEHGAEDLDAESVSTLFDARGADFHEVCKAADQLRAEANGDVVTYVVNRNINYTNICGYRCSFCAFSKGNRKHAGGERAYLLDVEEIAGRAVEARRRGASEVCLQGGIHPHFTGETYLNIVAAVKRADPDMHVHAFSPLEVWHGAATLDMHLRDYLGLLKKAGLGSLPGTAAEILHDPVREILCPDKITSEQWLEVIETAHEVGLSTTATIMFGHVDEYRDWAIHLRKLRDLQKRTGGFTEFVPLPFVAHESPLYKRGHARPGPTWRESILMHAVSRLVLFPHFRNIQASWVKMGPGGMLAALNAGANDLGGTLMDESITRAAGATHGQEMTTAGMHEFASRLGRTAVRRSTLYHRPLAASGGAMRIAVS